MSSAAPCTSEARQKFERGLGLLQDIDNRDHPYDGRTRWRVENDEGARLIYESAEAGYAPAMREMGDLTRIGWGVPLSPSRAAEWYERAVELNDAESAFRLAWGAAKGDFDVPSGRSAAAIMRIAVDLGYVPAIASLAGWLLEGQGVERDPAEAADLLRQGSVIERVAGPGRTCAYNLERLLEREPSLRRPTDAALLTGE